MGQRYKKTVAENRKARFDYHIFESVEAGIELKGNEVKSLRMGRVNLRDSFARVEGGQAVLYGMHITPYEFARREEVNPLRTRRLLLNRAEIRRLAGKVMQKGFVLVPLRVYFLGNYAKIEIGVAKGKKLFDKKEVIKKKDSDRDMERELVDRQK